MRVTADTDWTNADIQVNLTSGTLKHVAPSFIGAPNGVAGFGDTAGHAPTLVAGDLTGGFNGVVGFAGAHIETPTSFESSWFTTETDDIGTFDIAMITFSPDARGLLLFRTVAGSEVEDGGIGGQGFPIAIFDGHIWVPEPSTLMLAGIGVLGLLGRRRRKH